MKKLVRLITTLAGLAVLAYVLRDRLIQLTAPREPELPHFRPMPAVPPASHDTGTTAAAPDDLTEIKGIGPVYSSRLADAGITTFGQLAAGEAGAIADLLDVSESRVADWIGQAQKRA